ncbi:MAG TPA: DUF3180 domain-containing protein [Tetrasphaera sp.]|uniref:DUF3180 domain-containing protein n=1 Tax=Nostocoides sp. TaxID=1917966 RepID=UPI002C2F87FA|nr:DUF3180 domain-containing protein [Tetrasphaera sp.]HNQ08288.1 DUF3180 domain-containing protein [Tetrasphaera sp.]
MGTGNRGLSWRVPVLVTLVVGVISALLTHRLMAGGTFPPAVPTLALVLLGGVGLLVLWFGWAVRGYLRGRKANLDPMRAARTLALAQAAALTGAALVGLYAGNALGLLPDWDLTISQRLLWSYLGGTLAGGYLVVCGLLSQHWCRIPPRENGGAGEAA